MTGTGGGLEPNLDGRNEMSGDHNMYCSGNQPDSEALKLAKDLGCEIPSGPEGREFFFYPQELEAFYNQARADALREAAENCFGMKTGDECARMIKGMMK